MDIWTLIEIGFKIGVVITALGASILFGAFLALTPAAWLFLKFEKWWSK